MNCPDCQCGIGQDQFTLGEWQDEADEFGVVTACVRVIALHCDHCGWFEIEQATTGGQTFIRAKHGPYRSTKNVRRVERALPTRQLEACA